MLRVLVCLAVCSGAAAQDDLHFSAEKAESLLQRAVKLSKGRVGEGGLGVGAGVVTGWCCKKVQNVVVNTALVCGAATAAACCTGYLDADDVMDKVGQATGYVNQKASGLLGLLDRNSDGKVDAADGKIALSKVRPFAKKHATLTAGFASGLLVGYQLG